MKKTKVIFNVEKLEYSVELARALAHPLRMKILQFIDQNGEINVNKIYNALRLEQSITSQHLSILRNADVVRATRDGKLVKYAVNYSIVDRAVNAVNHFLGK